MSREILEGKIEGKRTVGRRRRTWMDDIKEWTGSSSYAEVKKKAGDRRGWKFIVANLHI